MERASLVIKGEHVRIQRLELGPYNTNAYVVLNEATGHSILVDAPAEAAILAGCLKGTVPQYILMTHGHHDHVGALAEIHASLGIPVASHEADASHLPVSPEVLLKDGDVLPLGDVQIKILHTPGHTRGSLCFLVDGLLLSGDTLFPGGPGHTRTPSDLGRIIESITAKLFPLPDETAVYPGHGDSTEIGKAKEEYALFSARTHNPDLCGDVLWLSS